MKARNHVLVLCCAILAWGFWWALAVARERDGALRSDRGADGFVRVFAAKTVDWEGVNRIALSVGGDTAWEWERQAIHGGAWRQTKPFDFPVEAPAVLELLTLVRTLEARDGVSGEVAGESSGLSDVALPMITLAWDGGHTEVKLGKRLPAGCAWIEREGAPMIAKALLHDALLRDDLKRWRRTSLFERADIESECITSTATGSDGSIQRLQVCRDGPAWKLTSPVSTRADREAVERWLDALARASATGFVTDSPGDLGAFGLTTPSANVEIKSIVRAPDSSGAVVSREAIERLEIGAPVRSGAPEHFARLAAYPGAIMEIDAAAVAAAMPPAISLIDATMSGLRPADVRALRLEPKDGVTFRLERSGAGWILADADGPREASVPAVVGLLSRLCNDRATEIAQGNAPADLFTGKIIAEGFDGRDIAVIGLSRETQGGRFGVDDGSGVLRIYPAATQLFIEADDYKVRDPAAKSVLPPVPLPR